MGADSEAGIGTWNITKQHGLCLRNPVRGHSVYWGKESYTPDWMHPLRGAEAEAEIERRMEYMMDKYQDV